MKQKIIIICGLLLLSFTTKAEDVKINSTCKVMFSPNGGITDFIVSELNKAKKTVRIAAYSYTSEPIFVAILAATNRKVKVDVLVDGMQDNARGSKVANTVDSMIPLKLDKKHAIMHNKYIIIDDYVVITGSFNFTKSAESRNAENIIACGNKKLAATYNANWLDHWEHSISLDPPR